MLSRGEKEKDDLIHVKMRDFFFSWACYVDWNIANFVYTCSPARNVIEVEKRRQSGILISLSWIGVEEVAISETLSFYHPFVNGSHSSRLPFTFCSPPPNLILVSVFCLILLILYSLVVAQIFPINSRLGSNLVVRFTDVDLRPHNLAVFD